MINNEEEYRIKFQDESIRKEALKQALDIRKFEIDLYWKRATYFWTFLAATFAGYFFIHRLASPPNYLIFLISNLGFMFSFSWYLVNKGSKFWQNNWERHVDRLEDTEMGPLYKTVIMDANLKKMSFSKEYPFSVSKINQLLSLYVTFLWFFLLLDSFLKTFNIEFSNWKATLEIEFLTLLIFLATIYFVYKLFKSGVSNLKEEDEEIKIMTRNSK